MNIKTLAVALTIGCAFAAFAGPHHGRGGGRHPGGGRHHAPPPRHHGGPRWGYGPGFHRGPGPGSLVGWHRGALHPYYRSCWYGDVWYDAHGYAHYYPGTVTTTIITPTVQQTIITPTAY